ncbi:hypothetical protein Rrhod_2336 [Rhodococcus rhodnii LMG 5362]|uniref:Uncharacterized protein n=1 Tax=Rhodococcus rhodnii LMG 5362 TaxID=1273125 RepID=R7WM46_9NOCA|nr:hypothetical protein Rrhod_2336 [Rhodococcus rhodnii LMG 5362]
MVHRTIVTYQRRFRHTALDLTSRVQVRARRLPATLCSSCAFTATGFSAI